MPQSYFPLRWESTGDQWWYASPIDWAAANGHYDLVRELLHLDTNLLIKLTSLRRIRRLETVWDDDARFVDAAKCRSFVARNLFQECETKNRRNSLIRAGYGGWLLYTAASAGDMSFVKELLDRDPLLVFGEGEYGVTDILYAAARSKNSEVFRFLFGFVVPPNCSMDGGGDLSGTSAGGVSIFRWEMMNRAVHAAARGGNLEILKELIAECSDVLAYRDLQSSTILHAASGRGQVEIVKYLVASVDIVNSRDNQGNTSLHVAAFRGHLSVLEVLIAASPTSSTLTNNAGDTFLHMAVAGFRTPGFKRLDRQMELVKQLIIGELINIQQIINIRNNDGRTALHMAVVGNLHSDLVELLMTIKSIDLNIRDAEGMTPLDLLRRQQLSASSEILIKQLMSAGGISNSKDHMARSAIASTLRKPGIGSSPGTSFRISDAEIFLFTAKEASEISARPSSCSSTSKSDLTYPSIVNENHKLSEKKKNPVDSAARHLKILFRWPNRKAKKAETPKKLKDDDSFDSIMKWCDREETPTPLRQQFSKGTTLLNNKRTLAVRSPTPSSSTKKKFTTNLMHGVLHAMPHLAPSSQSPSTSFSRSSISSEKQKGISLENDNGGASCSNSSANYSGMMDNASQKSVNTRLMNQYFCFGAQGLAMDDPVTEQSSSSTVKCSLLSVA